MRNELLGVFLCFLHDACYIGIDDSHAAALASCIGGGFLTLIVLLFYMGEVIPSFL